LKLLNSVQHNSQQGGGDINPKTLCGSGFSNAVSSIKDAEPDATVLDGLAIKNSNVNNAEGENH